MSEIPTAVTQAIANFVPDDGMSVAPPRKTETSYIFKWGVRMVKSNDAAATPVWMCLASETCREKRAKFRMSGGKTSKATNHLTEMHSMDSKKTTAEGDRKRTRENELELLKRSPLFRNDPGRAYVLLETRRIVNNNLPFRLGEYEETLLIRDLMLKEHAQVALNAKVIRHAVVELYDATKRQVQAMLQNNTIGSAKCFSIV
ncbi:hypothetical protein BBJ28_00020793, partial [Nothophytophthora sp. Chile5]